MASQNETHYRIVTGQYNSNAAHIYVKKQRFEFHCYERYEYPLAYSSQHYRQEGFLRGFSQTGQNLILAQHRAAVNLFHAPVPQCLLPQPMFYGYAQQGLCQEPMR